MVIKFTVKFNLNGDFNFTFASRGGGFEGQSIDGEVGAFKSFQVEVGGDFLAFGSEVRMTDILPGFLTVQNALFDLVGLEGSLQTKKDGLLLDGGKIFNSGATEQTTSQQRVLDDSIDLLGASSVVGELVDNDGATQDAAGAFFVQRNQRGDQADVSAGRRTREGLSI